MSRELAEATLPEEEHVLTVERNVGVGGKEPRAEEGVRAVGRLFPEDVGERDEPHARGRDERRGGVRPDSKFAIDRAERVPDVDRENPPGHEHSVARAPSRLEHPKHPRVIHRPERAEQPVPLRDHRIRGGGEHEMDRAVGDSAQPASIAVDQPDGTSGQGWHGRGEPYHG